MKGALVRRELTLEYRCSTGDLVVQVSGSDKEFVASHLQGKYGPVEELDLFVGAVLEVFGKPTELKQASLETASWIQAEGRRLDKLKQDLTQMLRKYGVHADVATDRSSTSSPFRTLPNPASARLRERHMELERLYSVLVELRPKDAAAWRRRVSRPSKDAELHMAKEGTGEWRGPRRKCTEAKTE